MWLSAFTTVAGWINLVIGWFQGKEAAQTAANTAEQNSEIAHQNDGAQSVADRDSTDQQNTALDAIAKQIDNPAPVVVEQPKA